MYHIIPSVTKTAKSLRSCGFTTLNYAVVFNPVVCIYAYHPQHIFLIDAHYCMITSHGCSSLHLSPGPEADYGALQWQLLQSSTQANRVTVPRGSVQLRGCHWSSSHQWWVRKGVLLASLIFVLRFLPFGDVSLNICLLNVGCGDFAVVMCLLHSIWCAWYCYIATTHASGVNVLFVAVRVWNWVLRVWM